MNNNENSEIVHDILYYCVESFENHIYVKLNNVHHKLPLNGLRLMADEMGIEDDMDEYRMMIASQLETLYEGD